MKRWAVVLSLCLGDASWAAEAEGPPDAGVSQRLLDLQAREAPSKLDLSVGQASEKLREGLPREWRSASVLGLERWQWLAVPVLAALIALFTVVLVHLSRLLIRRLRKEPRNITGLAGPLRLWWAVLLGRLALPALALSEGTQAIWAALFRVVGTAAFFWGAWRIIADWSDRFASSAYAEERPGSRALVNLSAQVLRALLITTCLVALLSGLGYDVNSWLAGLGIGGIALALGAQKTLENLFGAFSLAIDQPIREGELVKVDDAFVGTVETIGLRSTRIRTFDRTLITLPNGKLSELRLETYAARDRIRLHTFIGVAYGTTAAQMKQVLEGCRAALLAHPKIFADNVTVHFARLGDSSLDVEVVAWFLTTDFAEFRGFREEMLLSFLAVVENAGTSVAFPTRTVHLVKEK